MYLAQNNKILENYFKFRNSLIQIEKEIQVKYVY